MNRDPNLSRRLLLCTLAVAPAVGSTIVYDRTANVDRELIRMGQEFSELTRRIDDAIDHRSELTQEVLDRLDCLDSEIVSTPANTVAGLRVKAQAACWALLGDINPCRELTTDKRMALSIVLDLIRIYDPHLEQPGALMKCADDC
jgi:hypothetical protein